MTTATINPVPASAIAASLAEAILTKRQARLDAKAHEPAWKPRRNYASNLSTCVRSMVYAHTHWQEKEPFTSDGVAHMEDGNHEEKLLTQELMADGFEVIEQQVQLDDDRYFVTGKIDGKLKWQGRKVPFEMKRISPYMFDKLDTVQDFKSDEFSLKKLRQLTLYLYLHSEEVGLFILSNGLGKRKVIVVPLDYELAESILKNLDATNAALKAGTLPERIPYHSKICGYCPFKRTCLPDMNFGEGAVMGDAELNVAVARYAELKPASSEYDKLKKSIAASVKDKPLIVAGDYLITGEWKERNVKAQEARTDRFWSWELESKAGSNGHVA